MKSKEEKAELVELLFQECCFDPDYMDEKFTRDRFKSAVESLTDSEFDYIWSKIMGRQLSWQQQRTENPRVVGSSPTWPTNGESHTPLYKIHGDV